MVESSENGINLADERRVRRGGGRRGGERWGGRGRG